jgi:hypothetical protein
MTYRATRLSVLRPLELERPPGPGRPRHLSAASALALVGDYAYVIADDENHLGMFPRTGRAPGRLVRLRPGTLPATRKARKKRKPDFEALISLPPFPGHPWGALFVLGSGSRPNRRTGILLGLDADGHVRGRPRPVDLTTWYAALARTFREVNIEGGFVSGATLSLLQRGNKGDARNALIRTPLAPVLAALGARRGLPRLSARRCRIFDLGGRNGVPLCFTDAVALPGGGFAFTAVAEDTGDAVADGACAASTIGIVGDDDSIRAIWRLEPPLKVEGIAAQLSGDVLELIVVTDADDPEVRGRMLRTRLTQSRVDD